MFFLLFYQTCPWNPLSTYNNHKTPSVCWESLPPVSSKDNRALITARLTLLNCALEQKSAQGKQSLAHLHGKSSECSTAWPPEREPEPPLCQSGGIFTTSCWFFSWFFSVVALLLGARGSPVAWYQTVYDLTKQCKTYSPSYTWQWQSCCFLQDLVFFRLDFRQDAMTIIEVHDGKSGPDSQLEKCSLQLMAILSQDLRRIDQAKETVLSKESCYSGFSSYSSWNNIRTFFFLFTSWTSAMRLQHLSFQCNLPCFFCK